MAFSAVANCPAYFWRNAGVRYPAPVNSNDIDERTTPTMVRSIDGPGGASGSNDEYASKCTTSPTPKSCPSSGGSSVMMISFSVDGSNMRPSTTIGRSTSCSQMSSDGANRRPSAPSTSPNTRVQRAMRSTSGRVASVSQFGVWKPVWDANTTASVALFRDSRRASAVRVRAAPSKAAAARPAVSPMMMPRSPSVSQRSRRSFRLHVPTAVVFRIRQSSSAPPGCTIVLARYGGRATHTSRHRLALFRAKAPQRTMQPCAEPLPSPPCRGSRPRPSKVWPSSPSSQASRTTTSRRPNALGGPGATLEELRAADRFRFVNHLSAWIEVDGRRPHRRRRVQRRWPARRRRRCRSAARSRWPRWPFPTSRPPPRSGRGSAVPADRRRAARAYRPPAPFAGHRSCSTTPRSHGRRSR